MFYPGIAGGTVDLNDVVSSVGSAPANFSKHGSLGPVTTGDFFRRSNIPMTPYPSRELISAGEGNILPENVTRVAVI